MKSYLLAQAPANAANRLGTGLTPPTESFSKDSLTKDGALGNLELFLSNLIGFLTITASLFFIVYFVMGAFKWTAAGGDSGKVSKARDQMIQGVLGLILIVASYSIIGLISTILGLNILTPSKQIEELINSRPSTTITVPTGTTTGN